MLTAQNSLGWTIPLTHPLLRKGEVHVWRSSLEVSSSRFTELRAVLSPAEAARACSYHDEEKRKRFTISCALLKKILARYLAVDPCDVQFSSSNNGKPELSSRNSRLRFNKSCSHHLALFAVARDCDVGIDVEQIGTDRSFGSIAEMFFAPEELIALKLLPLVVKQKCFFSGWTRKEAIVKALGCGLSISLQEFSVSLVPNVQAQLFRTRGNNLAAEEWSLIDLPMLNGYEGALAVRMTAPIVSFWDANAL